jgi:hypothetical protein
MDKIHSIGKEYKAVLSSELENITNSLQELRSLIVEDKKLLN